MHTEIALTSLVPDTLYQQHNHNFLGPRLQCFLCSVCSLYKAFLREKFLDTFHLGEEKSMPISPMLKRAYLRKPLLLGTFSVAFLLIALQACGDDDKPTASSSSASNASNPCLASEISSYYTYKGKTRGVNIYADQQSEVTAVKNKVESALDLAPLSTRAIISDACMILVVEKNQNAIETTRSVMLTALDGRFDKFALEAIYTDLQGNGPGSADDELQRDNGRAIPQKLMQLFVYYPLENRKGSNTAIKTIADALHSAYNTAKNTSRSDVGCQGKVYEDVGTAYTQKDDQHPHMVGPIFVDEGAYLGLAYEIGSGDRMVLGSGEFCAASKTELNARDSKMADFLRTYFGLTIP